MGDGEDGFKMINSTVETFSLVIISSSHVSSLPVSSSAFLLIAMCMLRGFFLGCVCNVILLWLLKLIKS